MDIIIHSDGHMYVSLCSMWYKVKASLPNEYDANIFLAKNPNCGVLAIEGKIIIIADNEDNGVKELSGYYPSEKCPACGSYRNAPCGSGGRRCYDCLLTFGAE